MAEENKDVLGARLNLDVSKMPAAFKQIDAGAKQNKASFEALNTEIVKTERTYSQLAKSMDKMALTTDERRKKMLDESSALVSQRNAAAELLSARRQQLDAANKLVDSKLQTQQALQKKREVAIEQQEREHQERMARLQNQTAASSVRAGRATGTDDATRERVLREEQAIRRKLAQMDEDAERKRLAGIQREASERERALQQEQRIRRAIDLEQQRADERFRRANQATLFDDSSGSVSARLRNAALHATAFAVVYSSIHAAEDAIRTGLVDIESRMAGYVQTNEHYFMSYAAGTGKMVKDTDKINAQTEQFLHTTHALGLEINDVTESARLWGRMYKDVGIVQEMVRNSSMLSTIDMVELEQSTKMTESTLAQYGVQINNVNDAMVVGGRILDSWSKVAHDTMAPAKEIGAAFERTGKIADEVGVSFDFMNGLMASGIRNTALGGANLGNMWKTVLGTIRTDKAVNELENLGVATKEVVDGTEQWRKAEDILLDLSIAVTEKNYDLTESYADISRGVYQYAKLAASLNTGDILLGMSASINSTGSTLDYLTVQMDTIQRKASQTKTSLIEIFSKAGDDGLRSSLKDALDVIDQLLIGISKLPKGTFETIAAIGGLVAAYKLIIAPLMAWKQAETALTTAIKLHATAQAVATEEMVIYSAAAANTARMTALATAGISAIVGVIGIYLMSLGSAEKKERELADARDRQIAVMQQQYGQLERQADFLPKLVNAERALQKQMDSGTLSADQQIEVKTQLDKVSKALQQTIGEEGAAQLRAAGYTDEATNTIIESLHKRQRALNEQISANLDLQASENDTALAAARKTLQDAKDNPEKKATVWDVLNPFGNLNTEEQARRKQEKKLQEAQSLVDSLEDRGRQIEQKRIDIAESLIETDPLAGTSGKNIPTAYETMKQSFQDDYSEFRHLVAIKAQGYVEAGDQLAKLQAIKSKYQDQLAASDLWGVEEDMVAIREGKGKLGDDEKPFNLPLEAIDRQISQAQSMTSAADAVIAFYTARADALASAVDDTSQRIELYRNRQDALHQSNELLRKSVGDLSDKQSYLDGLYRSGGITIDDYNRQTEEVSSRMASLTKEIDGNSVAWWNDAKAIREAGEQAQRAAYDFSTNWISHQKAIRDMSVREELAAMIDVQSRYAEGTDLRMKLDEQVYALKKQLLREEESDFDDFVSKQKDSLAEMRDLELQRIQDDRDAYVDAQDEKIKAIQRLIDAEDEQNSDDDYDKQLQEKKARLQLLQSAVGPEGIRERKELAKEIEKIELDHQRDLLKRSREADIKALQEEKDSKSKAFDEERKAAEDYYKELLKPFDTFKNDVEGRAEALKNVQIQKDAEKNSEILKNLDTFVEEYQRRMSAIAPLETSQRDIDLAEYNSNKDRWENASARGDTAEMARLNARNQELRAKYGITEDTDKLQHFDVGGRVAGIRGRPVPIMAHAGEIVLNDRQQGNLFRLLDFVMPKLQFSAPSFDFARPQTTTINNHWTISSGDVNLHDGADIETYFQERDTFIRRTQAVGGGKQR
ncbi:hypothetical protein [Paenibacillus cymbidii]|uniref:hypothetical protein n=1 Tax=Paenibacillus cymbidii TaxID=1639034 RepID=UPI0010806989|nr:hypothetical protein [Paenibacillus cymbidii]